MREIKKIIIHCSDSDNPRHDDISVIAKWHSERGWVGYDKLPGTPDDVGYHFFIKKDGTIQEGRKIEQIGAHCHGHNSDSIGICLSGKKIFAQEQFDACKKLISKLDIKEIYPHNHFEKGKTCPNFNIEVLK